MSDSNSLQIGDLSFLYNDAKTMFKLLYKKRLLLEHTPDRPCIIIGQSKPDFKMNPRYIAYYKLKNRIINKKLLIHFIILSHENTLVLEFENLLKCTFQINNGYLEINLENSNSDLNFNYFCLKISASKTEAIYGCGENFSYLNLRGRKIPLWTQEPGIIKKRSISKLIADLLIGAGGSWWTTYYPQPTFISSDNYIVHVDSYAYCEFDFRKKEYHLLSVNEIPKRIVIRVENSVKDLFSSLSAFLGRQRPLPEWALDGAWLGIGGGLNENDPNSVVSKIKRAKDGKVKIAAIWSEDWSGLRHFKAQTRLYWNWKFSNELYPNLSDFIKGLHAEGIRFLGYNNCFLMIDSEFYNYARDHGLLIKDKSGEPYKLRMFSFYAVMLDLSNPDTIMWIKSIIKDNMIGIGLDGWMCDFAEYVPIDCELHSKEDPYLHHNKYPVLWAKVNSDAVKEARRDSGADSIVFFSRSGNYGTSKYSPLIWAGDQIMNFSLDMGLAAAICATISIGFVGIGQTHSDIAGEYRFPWMKRTKELFMRWTEFSAFTCVMRTHEAKGTSGWTLDSDKETLDHFAKFSQIHAQLKPYLIKCIEGYSKSGLPIVRHPYLNYENDKILHSKKPRSLQYEYLLGSDLLIAPVYKKGALNRDLYLPQDDWVHLWSGKSFKGGWIRVSAPLGEPPVFYRQNSEFRQLFENLIKE